MQPNDKALYVILKSPHRAGDNGTQLALHVQLWDNPERLCFDDTARGHMIEGEMAEMLAHSFTFKDRNGGTWELREVTIQEYRHRLAKHIENGDYIAKTLKTTEDLWEWYRKAFPI